MGTFTRLKGRARKLCFTRRANILKRSNGFVRRIGRHHVEFARFQVILAVWLGQRAGRMRP